MGEVSVYVDGFHTLHTRKIMHIAAKTADAADNLVAPFEHLPLSVARGMLVHCMGLVPTCGKSQPSPAATQPGD